MICAESSQPGATGREDRAAREPLGHRRSSCRSGRHRVDDRSRLAEAGLTTRIVTAAPTERTTSYAAGAICGPVFDETDDPVGAWSQVGFDEFTALAANPRTGVRLRESIFVSPAGMTGAPPILRPAEARALRPDEVSAGYGSGFVATVPCVDMPRYLKYLGERFEAAGGVVESQELASLANAAELAPLIANCAGLGARKLVPDLSVRPIRGQHVVVENPGIDRVFMEPPFGPAWAGIIPHGDVVAPAGSPSRTTGTSSRIPRLRTRSSAAASPSSRDCGTPASSSIGSG